MIYGVYTTRREAEHYVHTKLVFCGGGGEGATLICVRVRKMRGKNKKDTRKPNNQNVQNDSSYE